MRGADIGNERLACADGGTARRAPTIAARRSALKQRADTWVRPYRKILISAYFKCLLQLRRGLLQVAGLVALLWEEFEAVAEVAGNDVDVGVEDHLSGGLKIVHADIEALGVKGGPQGLGHPAADLAHFRPELVGQLQQILVMNLGNDQGMAVVDRGDIQKGQNPGVSRTRAAGSWPWTMRQKMQSGMNPLSVLVSSFEYFRFPAGICKQSGKGLKL